MKITIDSKIPYIKGVFEPYAEVQYLSGSKIKATDVKDADALLIRTRTKCNKRLLEGSKVKFIGTATIGHDHIDKDYCNNHGIKWMNAPGCNSSAVCQYVIATLFHLKAKHNFDFSSKTLGIVGVGHIGAKVANIARKLGLKVLLNDPPRARGGSEGFVDLKTIAEQSDIISFHVPLNMVGPDKTYHLFDENFLSTKKRPYIINTSRGSVIKTNILTEALEVYNVMAAVIDVWEDEPIIDQDLHALSELGTPHIAGYSAEGKINANKTIINGLKKHFNLDDLSFQNGISEMKYKILIDCKGLNDYEIIDKAIQATYNIKVDDVRLRSSLDTFELQRANYPMRREFSAYRVALLQGTKHVREILTELGFQMTP